MMIFDVNLLNDSEIDFNPTTKIEEILQNIKTILTTSKYTVPLDREFGINAKVLDSPTEQAKNLLTSEIFDAINKYEPRATVTEVTYESINDGKLTPKVKVVIESE